MNSKIVIIKSPGKLFANPSNKITIKNREKETGNDNRNICDTEMRECEAAVKRFSKCIYFSFL